MSRGGERGRIRKRSDLPVFARRKESEGEMDDRPQEDRAEDRRRRGPLGDEEDAGETTRRAPRDEEDAETRRIAPEDVERETETGEDETGEVATDAPSPEGRTLRRASSGDEDPETRVIRPPGSRANEATPPYAGDYPDAPELREARLREVYGGVDWLASFIGCVFALVCGGVLLSLASLVMANLLGLAINLGGPQFDATVITSLVLVGVALFVAYFLGGYVAGRLARFDGGRNGAATVLWGILLSVLLALFGSLLPGLGFVQAFVQDSAIPAASGLAQAGLVGLGVVIGALLLELLGGFLGGRLGNSYHTRIDETQ